MIRQRDLERHEVCQAANRINNPKNTMISRPAIEYEITTNPEQYPVLSRQSSRYVKQVITRVMNSQFTLWNHEKQGNRANWVWVIVKEEVSA